MKFEYQLIQYCYGPELLKASEYDMIDYLNRLGEAGWDIFNIIHYGKPEDTSNSNDPDIKAFGFKALAKRSIED